MEKLFYKLIYDKRLKRSITILEILYKTKHDVTIKELERILDTTQKTVLSTVDYAKTLLPSSFSLSVDDRRVRLHNNGSQSIEAIIIEIAKKTLSYQIIEQAFYDTEQNIHTLANKLFVSESTLRVRIKYINKMLSIFKCRLSFYDIKISGDEENIRYFYYIYFSELQELFLSEDEEKIEYSNRIIDKIKKEMVKGNHRLLKYSFQQVARWLLISRDRMRVGNFVQIDEALVERMKARETYASFKCVYEEEVSRYLNSADAPEIKIPEEEIVWAYLICLHSVVYLRDNEKAELVYDEKDCAQLMSRIDAFLEDIFDSLPIHNGDKEEFMAIHSAYLINLAVLSEITTLFQFGYPTVKNYVLSNLERLYITWSDKITSLKKGDLFDIEYLDNISAQLAMITSQFVYNQHHKAERVIYSFEGEAGLVVYLETLARTLQPKGVEAIFIYSEPITQELVLEMQPDIVVFNYQLPDAIKGCKMLRMSHIPQVQEWTLLRELIINIDDSLSGKPAKENDL